MLSDANRLVTATTAKTGSQCTALIDGIPTVIEVARDLTVASGDVLFVARYGRSQWFALARAYTAAPAATTDNDPPPDPKPATVTGKLVIAPLFTGSWNGTAWRTDNADVYQGQYGAGGNHTGISLYGEKPQSLAGTTVLSASIAVRRLARGLTFSSPAASMWLVTNPTKPVGAPTLTSSATGPALGIDGETMSFAVPAAWAQAMVDGTAGGIGFFVSGGSPFLAFAGNGSWGPAFTMTIEWQRG